MFRKAWLWLAAAVAIGLVTLGALLRGLFARQSDDALAEENARRAREQAVTDIAEARRRMRERVSTADAKAKQEVENATRTGSLADHLRNDGAGK